MKALVSNQERKLRSNFGGNVDLSSQPDLVYLRNRSRTASANTSFSSSPSDLSRAMSTISLPSPFYVSIFERFTVKSHFPCSSLLAIFHFLIFMSSFLQFNTAMATNQENTKKKHSAYYSHKENIPS